MSEKPRRIQLTRAKGWRMPENTVIVDRRTRWGNPFDFRPSVHSWTALSYGCRGDRPGRHEASVKAFREWVDVPEGKVCALLERQVKFGPVSVAPKVSAGMAPSTEEIRTHLRGKNLACWCKPGTPCHADVLLEIANRPICEEVK